MNPVRTPILKAAFGYDAAQALLCGMVALALAPASLPAQSAPGEIVVLPELQVTGKRIIPPPEPWRYAQSPNFEVLSSSSDTKTREFTRYFGQFLNVLNTIAPTLRPKYAPPLKIIICGRMGEFKQFVPAGQSLNQVVISYKDPEQAFIVVNESDSAIYDINALGADDDGFAASMGAMGMSQQLTGGIITESIDANAPEIGPAFNTTVGMMLDLNTQINRAYLKLCFAQMNPNPPAWFEEGMIQLFMRMRISGNTATIGEITDGSAGRASAGSDTAGIAAAAAASSGLGALSSSSQEVYALEDFNSQLARQRLIPFDEFLSVDRESDTYKNAAAGTGKWALQCQAFIHYCLYRDGSRMQSGFAKYLTAASHGPVDEAFFKECFGMNYKGMEFAIQAYIENPRTVSHGFKFKESILPEPLEMRDSRDHETGRLKGDALRLAGKPGMGRAELLGPYSRKRIDPALLAALGLDEIREDNPQKAKTLLETAARDQVIRPLAYVALGRIYMAGWTEGENDGNKLAPEQLETIQKLVLAARVQYPPMPAVYLLYADALGATGRVATIDQIKILVEGCHAFSANLDLVYKTATLIVDSGDRKGALPLVEFGLTRAVTPRDKQRFEELAARASP